ncbi:MAG: hypothetical protein WKG00_03300 [Polyangiaceae bacterium]
MAVWSQAADGVPWRPPAVVTLQPNAFASTYVDRPRDPFPVGIRIIAEGDLQGARAVGQQKADRLHPGLSAGDPIWDEAYNQALMHHAIAAGTCMPDDVDQPRWEMADDMVPRALSPAGAARLFDEIEMLQIVDSPLSPEVTREDEEHLARLLGSGELLTDVPAGDARWMRRMLRAVLDRSGKREG